MDYIKTFLDGVPLGVRAVLMLVGGWLVAVLSRTGVGRILRVFHFNQMCERVGVNDFLRKGEVRLAPSELVAWGFYWVLVLGVMLETARLLNIKVVTDFRARVVAAVPPLLSALLVLLVGLLVVVFVASFVRTCVRNAGSPYANLWSRITRWIGVFMVLAIAVDQAEIRGSVVASVIYIIFAAAAFGIALAFGLGCKDMARNAMEKLIATLKERHRDDSKPDLEG